MDAQQQAKSGWVDELQVGQIDNFIIRIVFGEFADELPANRMFVEGKSSSKVYFKPVSTLLVLYSISRPSMLQKANYAITFIKTFARTLRRGLSAIY